MLNRVFLSAALAWSAFFLPSSAFTQISLATAVDLALRNSNAVKIASADVQRAEAALSETKDVYIPSFLLGSSIGYSYGFPVGQPSIYTVQSQSLLYTFSQRDYIRSARSGLHSAQLALNDARQQVMLDSALDYIQMDSDRREIAVLEEENTAAGRLAQIEQQRLDAGLESRTDLLKTKLIAAQVRLKQLHLEDDLEIVRNHLAHLTGMPASTIITESPSLPPAPDLNIEDSSTDVHAKLSALDSNQGVQAAYANAKSRMYQAFGDARQIFRPQFGFGAQYSRFAKFNNYQEYYQRFQHNNFEIGAQITLPLYDVSRKAKERESRANAAHAFAEADQVRDQASENILLLRKSLRELAAQKDVAQIQSELAHDQLQAVVTQLQSAAVPGSSPTSPKEEQQARIEERRRAADLIEAEFELTKTQLGLLRAAGEIETWFKALPQQ